MGAPMFVEVNPAEMLRELRKAAKALLGECGCKCICLGFKFADTKRNPVKTYIGASGEQGRKRLLEAFNDERIDNRSDWTLADLTALLTRMADELVKYRSKTVGPAVQQAENWVTHNCAESNLAMYLFKQGKQLGDFTIASYELKGTVCQYKPLCSNCVQWCRNQFTILEDYKRSA